VQDDAAADLDQAGPRGSQPDQLLDETCPQCGARLVRKHGRFGEFVACSQYPTCKYVQLKKTGVLCPKDGGEVVERRSRRGKIFFGCSNYPACDFTLWSRPLAEKCPKCGSPFLVEKTTKRHGRQVVCNTDGCDYARSEEPVAV
jgi:DNA topoisomerase-1